MAVAINQMTLQLQNLSNWEQIYGELLISSKVLTVGGSSVYVPIPPVDLPFILDNFNIAIRCDNAEAGARWYLGARADAYFAIPSIGSAAPLREPIFQRFDCRINRVTFLQIPQIAPEYRLRFDIPYWFERLQIRVWQYVGPT